MLAVLSSFSNTNKHLRYYYIGYTFRTYVEFEAHVISAELKGESVALLVARRTNNRKVVNSRPTKVLCITFDRLPPRVNCPLWPATTPSPELYVGSWSLDCQR